MLRLRELGVGQCTDRLKDKSNENTCIQGGKQTEKTNRQEKQGLKRKTLRGLSLFLFNLPSSFLVLESVSKLETHHT